MEKLQAETISLLIVGGDLAGLGGLELVRSVRSKAQFADLPIIGLCEPHDRSTAQRLARSGVHCLPRPVKPGALAAAVMRGRAARTERSWQTLPTLPRKTLSQSKALYDAISLDGGQVTTESLTIVREAAASIVDLAGTQGMPEMLEALSRHDTYTFVHNVKVASLLAVFSQSLGVGRHDCELLAQAGLLHDIGKMRTPLEILHKPSRLTADEWRIMRQHAPDSAEMMRRSEQVDAEIILVAERHHEKIDGTGYPFGLKGTQIDNLSVLAAIADVYSALTDHRPYKAGMPPEKAFDIMQTMAGSHLEPSLLKRFVTVMRDTITGAGTGMADAAE